MTSTLDLSCLIGNRRGHESVNGREGAAAAFLSFWFFFFLCGCLWERWKTDRRGRRAGPRIGHLTIRWFGETFGSGPAETMNVHSDDVPGGLL